MYQAGNMSGKTLKEDDHDFSVLKNYNQLSIQSYSCIDCTPVALYEELHACSMPNAILICETDILRDGNCLIHSIIRLMKLRILTSDMRKQLLEAT
ncbi:Hypothetical protein CINCED_3A002868 [Cinara cedri]|uniref:Uncharacterized protein n=1 Tax=Cinara cedri TaxID=506608 RepID=A0A5E4MDK3_9HEMI|nr:Hypothetical protein CINCED_3A002868 [Cinara cedri]